MNEITQDYIESLPPIYRDVLAAFQIFNSRPRFDNGVAFQSLYSSLYDKYTLAEIRVACERMAAGGVLTIENEIFAHPTAVGAEIISRLPASGAAEETVPQFISPPTVIMTDE